MIFTLLKKKILFYRVNRSQEAKRAYLRSLGCIVGEGTRFMGKANVGDDPYLVEIGADCLISDDVRFYAHDGGVKVLNTAGFFDGEKMDKMARIKIGNNCFIGSGTKIMGGVKIGNDVVVGAGSIITRSIPDRVVVAGMPARIICTLEEYYSKNLSKGVFFPTPNMAYEDKKKYLADHVPHL